MSCSRCNKARVAAAERRYKAQLAKQPAGTTSSVQVTNSVDLSVADSNFSDLDYAGPAIRNSQWKPPAGGWGVTLMVRGRKILYNSSPELMVRKIIEDYKVIAGVDLAPLKVWNYLNYVWQQRDPMRAYVPASAKKPEPANDLHMMNSIEQAGPYLWTMLSVFGRKGMFDAPAFKGAVQYLMDLFGGDTTLRCEQCLEVLTRWRISHDVEKVTNEQEAAEWVHGLHNEVNQLLGKPLLDFEAAIVQNGWDISLTA